MIIRITHPDQTARIIPEMTRAFADFLTRAKEPFTVEHQWAAILRGLAQGPGFLFLVAFDERVRPVAFVIAQAGYDWWGVRYGNIIQTYVKPGCKAPDEMFDRIVEWAKDQGVQVLSTLTPRDGPGYARWVGKRGFRKFAAMYINVLEGSSDGQVAEDNP